jgi:methylated-DNA-[protein]-cysteine S-methyltransferase
MELAFDRLDSPIGAIAVVARGSALCALDFDDCTERMHSFLQRRFGSVTLRKAADPCGFTTRVGAYMNGALDALDDIEVDTGGTAFQQEVWLALRRIPCGETTSYGAMAKSMGRPGAARAVGITNSRNPVALVLPCHRVIGADGSLTGYAGGIERKHWLLRHEGALPATLI